MDAILAALITAVVGGPILYYLGNRRLRYERLYERRAEVIATLSERLYEVQRALTSFASPVQSASVDREKQIQEFDQTFQNLVHYYNSNSVWLELDTCKKVEDVIDIVYRLVGDYMGTLNERFFPEGAVGRGVGHRIMGEIQPLRRNLEQEFRAILYPSPWYEALLAFLGSIHTKDRNGVDDTSNTDDKDTPLSRRS